MLRSLINTVTQLGGASDLDSHVINLHRMNRSGQRTREVVEIPVVPIEVTEHVFVARICPVCERRQVPKVGDFSTFDSR